MLRQDLIGESQSFLTVLDQVSRLAQIERPVLIIGERGTGKELIAQRIHYLSKRWEQPLVTLNCSSLSEGLIDSELFGHEAGSFTGSKGRHQGRFERAEGGTLFLDELATAPLSVQEKLLRVIEYGTYERVGGTRPLNANVRLVCATNANLPIMVSQQTFRADLLDRLAFDVVHLPPLRERKDDILLLANHYAIKMSNELSLPLFIGFSQQVSQQLVDYHWPGNIRELKNVVERAVYQHSSSDKPIDSIVIDPFAQKWTPIDNIAYEACESMSLSQQYSEPENTNSQYSMPIGLNKLNLPSQHSSISHNPQNQTVNSIQDGSHKPAPSETFRFPMDYKQWQEEQDRLLLNKVMEEAKYNQRKAAQLLGLSYDQLRGMLKKYQFVGSNNL